MELTAPQLQAFEFLEKQYGDRPFSPEEAARYMHPSIIEQLIESGVISHYSETQLRLDLKKRMLELEMKLGGPIRMRT